MKFTCSTTIRPNGATPSSDQDPLCKVFHLHSSRYSFMHEPTNERGEPTTKVGIPKIITEPKTTTMYHMHTFVVSLCMDLVHSGGFRFGDGFGYTYLSYG